MLRPLKVHTYLKKLQLMVQVFLICMTFPWTSGFKGLNNVADIRKNYNLTFIALNDCLCLVSP